MHSLVEDQMANAGFGKVSAESRSGRATANHDHICVHGGCTCSRGRGRSKRWHFLRPGFAAAGEGDACAGAWIRAWVIGARRIACEVEQLENFAAELEELRTIS